MKFIGSAEEKGSIECLMKRFAELELFSDMFTLVFLMSISQNHQATHSNQKDYVCETCKRAFKTKGSLKVSLIISTENNLIS